MPVVSLHPLRRLDNVFSSGGYSRPAASAYERSGLTGSLHQRMPILRSVLDFVASRSATVDNERCGARCTGRSSSDRDIRPSKTACKTVFQRMVPCPKERAHGLPLIIAIHEWRSLENAGTRTV